MTMNEDFAISFQSCVGPAVADLGDEAIGSLESWVDSRCSATALHFFPPEGNSAFARAAAMSGVALEVSGKSEAWQFIPQCDCAFVTAVAVLGVALPWSNPLLNTGLAS